MGKIAFLPIKRFAFLFLCALSACNTPINNDSEKLCIVYAPGVVDDGIRREPCCMVTQRIYDVCNSQLIVYYGDGNAHTQNIDLSDNDINDIYAAFKKYKILEIDKGNWFSGAIVMGTNVYIDNIYINVVSTNYTRVPPHETRTHIYYNQGKESVHLVVLNYPFLKKKHDELSTKAIKILDLIDSKLNNCGIDYFFGLGRRYPPFFPQTRMAVTVHQDSSVLNTTKNQAETGLDERKRSNVEGAEGKNDP